MGQSLLEMVAELESLWIEPSGAELGQLTALLAERQKVLTRIQNADAGSLDPGTRRALAEHLARIGQRDATLLAALDQRRAEALKKLDGVMQARSAARGYRPAEGADTRKPSRIA